MGNDEAASGHPKHIPKLICFDLDATLWDNEMYLIDGPPFKLLPNGVKEVGGAIVDLFPDVRPILVHIITELVDENGDRPLIACASSTDRPTWAREVMRLLPLPPETKCSTLSELIPKDLKHIYDQNKQNHFKAIHAASGVDFEDMLFFDDMSCNCRAVNLQIFGGNTSVYT
eukprot:Platyproteum_vivax@DN5181_c0_g1_i2.p2